MVPDPPDLDAWRAWTPAEAAARLGDVDAPWCVVGGWALDLWHGRTMRPHEDLEIAIPRPRFEPFRRALSDFPFYVAGSGEIHYLPPDAPPSTEHHQNWVLDPRENAWRMDLFLEPGDDATWICRRDESIHVPRAETVGHSAEGLPYLRPQFVLLFKAKATRPKDEADFALALPRLDPDAKAWLRTALARIHPGHPWIDALA